MPTKEDWGGAEGDGRPAVQNEGFQKHSWLLHLELLDTSRGSAATLDSAQCGAEGLLTTACQAVVASQHLGRGGGGAPCPEGHPIVRFLSWNLLLPSRSFFPASLPEQCLPSLGDSRLTVSMNSQITFLSSLGRGRGHKEGQESITPFSVTHPLLTPVTTQGQEP